MAKPHSTDVIDQITGFISGTNLSVNTAVATDKIIDEDSSGAEIASMAAVHSATEFFGSSLFYVSTSIEINGNLLSEASCYTDEQGNRELAA